MLLALLLLLCAPTWWEHGCCWLAAVQVIQVAAQQQLALICGSPVQRLATLSIPADTTAAQFVVVDYGLKHSAAAHANQQLEQVPAQRQAHDLVITTKPCLLDC
jgi:hypothetical protein